MLTFKADGYRVTTGETAWHPALHKCPASWLPRYATAYNMLAFVVTPFIATTPGWIRARWFSFHEADNCHLCLSRCIFHHMHCQHLPIRKMYPQKPFCTGNKVNISECAARQRRIVAQSTCEWALGSTRCWKFEDINGRDLDRAGYLNVSILICRGLC